MKRKWVILAAIAFLGVVAWVVVRGNQKGYPFESVQTVLSNHGAYSAIVTESRIEMPVFRARNPYGRFLSFVDQLKYDIFSEPYSGTATFYSLGSESGFTTINLSCESGRVHEVVIEPDAKASRDALEIQSKISKSFTNLKCRIKAPSK
jgi:hypothetical protein